jgi:hypothetical protein
MSCKTSNSEGHNRSQQLQLQENTNEDPVDLPKEGDTRHRRQVYYKCTPEYSISKLMPKANTANAKSDYMPGASGPFGFRGSSRPEVRGAIRFVVCTDARGSGQQCVL